MRVPPFTRFGTQFPCRDHHETTAFETASSNKEDVRRALRWISDVTLLADVYATALFNKDVLSALRRLPLPALAASRVDWLAQSDASHIRDLYCDVRLCRELKLETRLSQIESAIHVQQNRVAHAFNSALAAMAGHLAMSPTNWQAGIEPLSRSLSGLKISGHEEIYAAQYYVRSLGVFLRPVCEAANSAGEAAEFGAYVEQSLIPALNQARIGYESGPLSVCDLLQSQRVCGPAVLRILTQVEGSLNESDKFKSGDLIDLSTRFARAGDLEAARRVLVSGIRAAFTYGFRKDTTINSFILAFEAIAPHLGQRRSDVVPFIASVLAFLDRLTDARMISKAPAHFVAVVCKFDIPAAAKVATALQQSCRQLRSPIAPALRDHGLDVESVRRALIVEAPTLDIGDLKDGDDDRVYFVTDNHKLPTKPAQFRSSVHELIESSRYATGLLRLHEIVVSLVAQGQVAQAIDVFTEFEHAMHQLVAVYPPFANAPTDRDCGARPRSSSKKRQTTRKRKAAKKMTARGTRRNRPAQSRKRG